MAQADRFILTGAASGIGAKVTDLLVSAGHRVLGTDIDESALRQRADAARWPSERVMTRRLDVTRADDWRAALDAADEAWGGVDVLYNIAGFLQAGLAHEVELRDIDRHFDINVKGVVLGTRLAAERMVARGRGHIVNIASLAAYAPVPGLALYSASKYAVRCFSLAAAEGLRPHGVAVTVVCPDAVATPMLDKQQDDEHATLTFTGSRVLTPDEVAEHLVGPVLRDRPLETALPRMRKWLARMVDLAPGLSRHVAPFMEKQGRANQRRYRGEPGEGG
jgi:3-oxoacyl-[acyl-carrier protein] reductase